MNTSFLKMAVIALSIAALNAPSVLGAAVDDTQRGVFHYIAVPISGSIRAFSRSSASVPNVLTQGPVFGARCVTNIGWCPISPQPVGAPCTCGNVNGITMQ